MTNNVINMDVDTLMKRGRALIANFSYYDYLNGSSEFSTLLEEICYSLFREIVSHDQTIGTLKKMAGYRIDSLLKESIEENLYSEQDIEDIMIYLSYMKKWGLLLKYRELSGYALALIDDELLLFNKVDKSISITTMEEEYLFTISKLSELMQELNSSMTEKYIKEINDDYIFMISGRDDIDFRFINN